MKLRLASKSPTRLRMLEAAGLCFTPIETSVDEEAEKIRLAPSRLGAAALADALAEAKARGAAAGAGEIVLGSDQILERDDGSIMGKAASREQAHDLLRSLSGRIHRLHSAAVALRDGNRIWGAVETAHMTVRSLDDAFIKDYLDQEYDQVRGNVGLYRIEGPGVQLFDRIEGSHFAILGLPLLSLLRFVREQEAAGAQEGQAR